MFFYLYTVAAYVVLNKKKTSIILHIIVSLGCVLASLIFEPSYGTTPINPCSIPDDSSFEQILSKNSILPPSPTDFNLTKPDNAIESFDSKWVGIFLFCTFGLVWVGCVHYIILTTPQKYLRLDKMGFWTDQDLKELNIVRSRDHVSENCCVLSKFPDSKTEVIMNKDLFGEDFTNIAKYTRITFAHPTPTTPTRSRTILTVLEFDSTTGEYENMFSDTSFMLDTGDIIDLSIKVFLFL